MGQDKTRQDICVEFQQLTMDSFIAQAASDVTCKVSWFTIPFLSTILVCISSHFPAKTLLISFRWIEYIPFHSNATPSPWLISSHHITSLAFTCEKIAFWDPYYIKVLTNRGTNVFVYTQWVPRGNGKWQKISHI